MKFLKTHEGGTRKSSLLVVCEINEIYLDDGAGPMRGVPFMKVFLNDPSPYLLELLRKSQRTQKTVVRKCVQGLNI